MAVLFPLYQWFTIQLAYWCNFHLTKTEETDMCKAIEDIREEGKNEGRDEERFSLLVELVNEGSIDVDKALEKLHMSLDEFYKKKTEYEKGN